MPIYSSVPAVFSDHEESISDFEEQSPNNRSPVGGRKRIEPEKTRVLMRVFEFNQKPDTETRVALARQLDMSPRSVQIWFQNRRAKLKRGVQAQRGGNSQSIEPWNSNVSPSESPAKQSMQQPETFIQTTLQSNFSNQMVLTPTRILPPFPSQQPMYGGYTSQLPELNTQMEYPTLPVINIIPDETLQETVQPASFSELFNQDNAATVLPPPAENQQVFNSNGHDFLLNQTSHHEDNGLRKVKSMNDLREDDEDAPALKRRKSMDLLAMIDSL